MSCNWKIGTVTLLLLAACAQDGDRGTEVLETAEQTFAGESVLPQAAATTYQTWSKLEDQPALTRNPRSDLEVTFARKDNATVMTASGAGPQQASAAVTLADGVPSVRSEMPRGVVDLLELVPPPRTVLKLGETYESSGPDPEYVFEEADRDRMVMWQPMVNEPVAIVRQPGFTMVRVENTGLNRLYFVDDDGSLRSVDMGEAFVAVTDLIKVDGQGWQVLRFARFTHVDGGDTSLKLRLSDVRTRKHAAFVVCASRMDVLGAELTQAHGLLLDDVPEFANCEAR